MVFIAESKSTFDIDTPIGLYWTTHILIENVQLLKLYNNLTR